MGGSGGTYSSRPASPERVSALVEQANQEADEATYESEVNQTLREALLEYNDRDIEGVRRHLDAVKNALEAEGDGVIELRYGGSVRKHTYVNGLSDVDVLALLDGNGLANMSPQAVIKEFAARLGKRFPDTDITPGKLAVTIRYADGVELQVLPALRTATGLRIARSVGEGWSNVVRPDAFARKLTSVNEARGGRMVSTIKLFKAMFEANCPPEMKISGYHAESLAIEAFEGYSGSLAGKEMLHHLCRSAANLVQNPIRDRTGQSLHVDDYLGAVGSQTRRAMAAHLERLTKRIESANRANDADAWQEFFDVN
ncbi:MAG: CBASS oligonucleotide cyclase [Thermomicrobiales bacterium]